VSRQCFVDRVVDHFPEAVHQTAFVGRPDVHARALADRLESFKDAEMAGGIIG
jgi:hypothetical protein